LAEPEFSQGEQEMKTLINVILDESGSMDMKRADVIGGFNRFLEEQKAGPDPARLSLLKFNTNHTVVYGAVAIADAQPLTDNTYVPGGNTALLDAVAQAVRLADVDKQADERVICLVITDGEENSSRETTKEQVRKIIEEREGRGDWTFTYLGISPEQWHDKGVVSSAGNAAAYNSAAPMKSFAAMSHATRSLRASASGRTSNFYQEKHPVHVPASPVPTSPQASPTADPWKQPHK
jgi:uncharacterized protein YegL